MAKPKTKKQKAKEAATKRRRDRAIVNATGDRELSRKYRNKGDDTIFRELGIKIPKRMPRLIKKENRGKQTRKIRSYIVSTPKIERDDVVFQSRIFKDRKGLGVKKPKTKEPKVTRKISGAVESLFDPLFNPVQDVRIKMWGEWSNTKKKSMPKTVKSKAFAINRRAGLPDDNAAYGYAVLYYAWVNNEPIELWLKRLVPDTDYAGELYLNVSGFGVKK